MKDCEFGWLGKGTGGGTHLVSRRNMKRLFSEIREPPPPPPIPNL